MRVLKDIEFDQFDENTGRHLRGMIFLGIQNFGVKNVMLKLFLSLDRSYNWLSDDDSLAQQSIHFSPFAAKAVLGEKKISAPDQLVSKS